MPLLSISYMSSAVEIPTREQIDRLLERSRAVNAQEQVTGVLFYADGNYHQYIEGPPEGVERVYARILASPLHRNVFELLREPIEEREFSDWSMGYRAVGVGPDDPILNRMLSDDASHTSAGRLLLGAYWERVVQLRMHALPGSRRPLP